MAAIVRAALTTRPGPARPPGASAASAWHGTHSDGVRPSLPRSAHTGWATGPARRITAKPGVRQRWSAVVGQGRVIDRDPRVRRHQITRSPASRPAAPSARYRAAAGAPDRREVRLQPAAIGQARHSRRLVGHHGDRVRQADPRLPSNLESRLDQARRHVVGGKGIHRASPHQVGRRDVAGMRATPHDIRRPGDDLHPSRFAACAASIVTGNSLMRMPSAAFSATSSTVLSSWLASAMVCRSRDRAMPGGWGRASGPAAPASSRCGAQWLPLQAAAAPQVLVEVDISILADARAVIHQTDHPNKAMIGDRIQQVQHVECRNLAAQMQIVVGFQQSGLGQRVQIDDAVLEGRMRSWSKPRSPRHSASRLS